MEYHFGTGLLAMVPAGANPTPVGIAVLQDVDLNIDFTIKELRGQYQFPVATARGAGKVAGKWKAGNINAGFMSSILTGATSATGSLIGVPNEVGTIPTTPFQLVVSHSTGTPLIDLGVYDATSQKPLTLVASAPATGQYLWNGTTGTYTFAAADTGHVVWMSYNYTAVTGNTVSFTNQIMGAGTTYTGWFFNQFTVNGVTKYTGFRVYAMEVPKLALPFKSEDFLIPACDYMAYADANGRVLDVYTTE